MTDLMLFAVVPYAAITLAAAGLAWRLSGHGAPITARSSQLLESRALLAGSVPWHAAIVAVLAAHAAAVVFPGTWGRLTAAPARLLALEVVGLALGLSALGGACILLVRRVAARRVRRASRPIDMLVIALLVVQVALGVQIALTLRWGSVWYVHTAAPWLRSLVALDPQTGTATVLPGAVRVHAVLGFSLLALLPFSRLVHVVAFPLGYAFGRRGTTRWTAAPEGVAIPRPLGAELRARAVATEPLAVWAPEDARFWERTGKAVAARNLWISIFALFLSFAVWMVWSMVVVRLPDAGFRLDTNALFWLAALPGLSGATLRIFYSFAVPVFGGRLWTTVTTASLLVPAIGIGIAVQNPATPYWVLLGLAALCGLGGGNFASSMANISFFYPKARKGTALGLNAGLGNLGVSGMQLIVPLAISAGLFAAIGGAPQRIVRGGIGSPMWLQNAAFVWVPFVVIAAAAAWLGMDDVASARASFRDQAGIFRRRHTWILSWLYLGTFGSFIGLSAGLPLLAKSQFPGVDPAAYAFLGPLVGALFRPAGGWLADRLGGARVTLWTFAVMIAAALGAAVALPRGEAPGSFAAFLAAFVVLFAASGVGNGSIYRMIPVVFLTVHGAEPGSAAPGQAAVQRAAATESAAVVGFASAVAAYGAFFVPRAFGTSLALTGGYAAALLGFVVYYLTCIALARWFYARRGAPVPC